MIQIGSRLGLNDEFGDLVLFRARPPDWSNDIAYNAIQTEDLVVEDEDEELYYCNVRNSVAVNSRRERKQ